MQNSAYKNHYLQACIEPCPSINCCCKPPGMQPLQYTSFMWEHCCTKQEHQTCARPFLSTKHIMVFLDLQVATYNTIQYNTSANPSLYLLVIVHMHSYMLLTHFLNMCLSFSYLGHIWVQLGATSVSRHDPISTLLSKH